MTTSIKLDRDGGIAHLRLVGPEGKPPTLDPSVLAALGAAVDALHREPPRLVILSSNSEKYFCVGANIKVLETINEDSFGPWVMDGHRVLNRLEDLPCPVVTRVSGYALGGGLELAMAADLIYASNTAKLGQTEAGLGFIPGWGGCHRFAERIGVARAKRYFFTGELIDAPKAETIGLVDWCGTDEELPAALDSLQNAILANSAYSLAAFKRITNDQQRTQRDANAMVEAEASRGCLQDPDTKSRLQAFLARKKT